MKGALILSVPVALCALLLTWLVTRRAATRAAKRRDAAAAGGVGESFSLQVVGYPTDRVDEVLERLDARIAANDALLAQRGAGESATAATVTGGDSGATDEVAGGRHTGEERPQGAAPVYPATHKVGWGMPDLVVVAVYLGTALHVLSNLVTRVSSGYLSQGVQDHQAFEWYFGASAHNVATLSNPLFSDRQNFPDGVNLMANAAMTGIGIPMAPLTLLAGAHVTFFVVELLGLAGTAAAWYWFMRRRGIGRLGAAVGGWFTGFAPAMVSHANGHPNFLALFLIPVIIDRILLLGEAGRDRRVRDAIVLGLLVTWQLFIGEEALLLAAIGIAIVGAVLALHRRVDVARMLPGVSLGAALTLVLMAVPLWWQFAGRQSYTSIWHPPGGNDLAALWGRATRTVGADPWASAALSMNRTEENAFFGVPLWLLAALIVVVLFRRPVVRALGLVIVVSAWMSLGEEVLLRGEPTGIPSLWSLFDSLPILENVLPTRFTMIAIPAFAGLLAIGIDAAVTRGREQEGWNGGWQARAGGWIATAAAVVALLPMLPTPLHVDPRPPVPTFFTGDAWRDWSHGGSILAVPPTDIVDARAFDWQLAADTMAFPIVEGYFVGPNGQPDRGGQYGATRRPLSLWLYDVNAANAVTPATEEQRRQFIEDLRAWRTDTVVLPMREQTTALRDSLATVLGQPEQVEDVYVWDVRDEVAS